MRTSPFTTRTSLSKARRWTRERALSTTFCAALASLRPRRPAAASSSTMRIMSEAVRCAYHASRTPISEARSMARRYSPTAVSTTSRLSAAEWPSSRPATSKLAARRLTSHSHGPGSVSSKSLMSKSIWRSGDANRPKLERCASPHSCTVRPVRGKGAKSAAISAAEPR